MNCFFLLASSKATGAYSHSLNPLENPPSSIDPPPIHPTLSARPATLRQAEDTPTQAGHQSLHQKLVISGQCLHHGRRAGLLDEARRAVEAVYTDTVLVGPAGRILGLGRDTIL